MHRIFMGKLKSDQDFSDQLSDQGKKVYYLVTTVMTTW